jgi:PAS domain-containing protein
MATSEGRRERCIARALLAEAAFDARDDHVAVCDPDGEIVAVNASWEASALELGGQDVGVGANYF